MLELLLLLAGSCLKRPALRSDAGLKKTERVQERPFA